jgi:hypothetical protein
LPLTPALFAVLSAWIAAHALIETPAASWAGLATVAIALALYAALGRSRKIPPGTTLS